MVQRINQLTQSLYHELFQLEAPPLHLNKSSFINLSKKKECNLISLNSCSPTIPMDIDQNDVDSTAQLSSLSVSHSSAPLDSMSISASKEGCLMDDASSEPSILDLVRRSLPLPPASPLLRKKLTLHFISQKWNQVNQHLNQLDQYWKAYQTWTNELHCLHQEKLLLKSNKSKKNAKLTKKQSSFMNAITAIDTTTTTTTTTTTSTSMVSPLLSSSSSFASSFFPHLYPSSLSPALPPTHARARLLTRSRPRGDYARSEEDVHRLIQQIEESKEDRMDSLAATLPDFILDVQPRHARLKTLKSHFALSEVQSILTLELGALPYMEDTQTMRPILNPLNYFQELKLQRQWSGEEELRFIQSYAMYGKDFQKIAKHIGTKTEGDVIAFYYLHKHRLELKKLHKQLKRGVGGMKDGYVLPSSSSSSSSLSSSLGLSSLSHSSTFPFFSTHMSSSTSFTPPFQISSHSKYPSRWTAQEIQLLKKTIQQLGKPNLRILSSKIKTKTLDQCKNWLQNHKELVQSWMTFPSPSLPSSTTPFSFNSSSTTSSVMPASASASTSLVLPKGNHPSQEDTVKPKKQRTLATSASTSTVGSGPIASEATNSTEVIPSTTTTPSTATATRTTKKRKLKDPTLNPASSSSSSSTVSMSASKNTNPKRARLVGTNASTKSKSSSTLLSLSSSDLTQLTVQSSETESPPEKEGPSVSSSSSTAQPTYTSLASPLASSSSSFSSSLLSSHSNLNKSSASTPFNSKMLPNENQGQGPKADSLVTFDASLVSPSESRQDSKRIKDSVLGVDSHVLPSSSSSVSSPSVSNLHFLIDPSDPVSSNSLESTLVPSSSSSTTTSNATLLPLPPSPYPSSSVPHGPTPLVLSSTSSTSPPTSLSPSTSSSISTKNTTTTSPSTTMANPSGVTKEESQTNKRSLYWKQAEKMKFQELLNKHGMNFEAISKDMETKTPHQVQLFYQKNKLRSKKLVTLDTSNTSLTPELKTNTNPNNGNTNSGSMKSKAKSSSSGIKISLSPSSCSSSSKLLDSNPIPLHTLLTSHPPPPPAPSSSSSSPPSLSAYQTSLPYSLDYAAPRAPILSSSSNGMTVSSPSSTTSMTSSPPTLTPSTTHSFHSYAPLYSSAYPPPIATSSYLSLSATTSSMSPPLPSSAQKIEGYPLPSHSVSSPPPSSVSSTPSSSSSTLPSSSLSKASISHLVQTHSSSLPSPYPLPITTATSVNTDSTTATVSSTSSSASSSSSATTAPTLPISLPSLSTSSFVHHPPYPPPIPSSSSVSKPVLPFVSPTSSSSSPYSTYPYHHPHPSTYSTYPYHHHPHHPSHTASYYHPHDYASSSHLFYGSSLPPASSSTSSTTTTTTSFTSTTPRGSHELYPNSVTLKPISTSPTSPPATRAGPVSNTISTLPANLSSSTTDLTYPSSILPSPTSSSIQASSMVYPMFPPPSSSVPTSIPTTDNLLVEKKNDYLTKPDTSVMVMKPIFESDLSSASSSSSSTNSTFITSVNSPNLK